ncbi:hypothetical protein P8V03_11760 [Clostridium sp. A1-XYC3]|uniref:Lipoprotein n=1 Tax=Clostridium tanneri TaxID=3037988 RepID=A0ABU4JUJ6_9CLOT|nr:hypothetical protein [Clostridium sp. A1-XYC3]MDW8801821.1 hypothetical protein [Clostridium sp. A1-XYC3]
MRKIIASLLIASSIISSCNFISNNEEKSHKKHRYGEKVLVLIYNSLD